MESKMRRTTFIILFVIGACCILCACGKSSAVTEVEGLIDSLGEITIESEEVISETETAYGLLADNEKEQVKNREILSAARKEIDRLLEEKEKREAEEAETKRNQELERKAREPYIGEWISLYYELEKELDGYAEEPRTISLADDGKYTSDDNSGGWEVVNDKSISLKQLSRTGIIGDFRFELVEDHGYEKLITEDKELCYVRKDQYQELYDSMFMRVSITEKNINDYIGAPKKIGETMDEWNEKIGDTYIMMSPLYEQGYALIACRDFQYEANISVGGLSRDTTFYAPYSMFWADGKVEFNGFGRAKGEAIYVNRDYIDSIASSVVYIDEGQARKITFTDGYSKDYFGNSWVGTTADLNSLEY